jgi:putative drug exporter of the RND superfamily
MIDRIARTSYRRRRAVVVSWVGILVAVSGLSAAFGGTFRDVFELPGSESQAAFDLLDEHGVAAYTGHSGQVVFTADDVGDPAVRRGMEALFAALDDALEGSEIVSPYDTGASHQVSDDGSIAYAEVKLSDRATDEYQDDADTVRALVGDVTAPGMQIELGGEIFIEEGEFSSEGIGLIAAVIILLVAFGSLLAMGLPLLTALFGIGMGVAMVTLVVNVVNMPSFATQAVLMIGIGVGIDYALFIVTRYREELAAGCTPETAVSRALSTAGRAVLFAGTTVIIAVLGLLLIGLDMVRGLSIGIAIGVAATMLAALTLLPAVLGFVGHNIDRLGLPHRRRAESADHRSIWFRWSKVIQRRPWPALIIATGVLILLAVPLFSLRLGFGDTGNQPADTTARKAYDLISEGFGPGSNGPLIIAAETPAGADDVAVLEELSDELNRTPGVAFAAPPQSNGTASAAFITVIPTTSPQDEATTDLVHTLRDEVIPAAIDGSSAEVKVGGGPSVVVDFADYMSQRLVWLIGAVLVVSFLILLVVFRSLLVSLKAIIMNLLSVAAAYGILVAVFQWGWGAGLFGIGRAGPIDAWIPMMLFAIVFGLSMDYEVFLLSRIREHYDRGRDKPLSPIARPSEAGDWRRRHNSIAVANGLASTARVITAAAAIMVCVFGAFALGDDRALQMFGLGLAVAIAIDASVVRLIIVPSAMELVGDRNWWLPGWLDRILPRVTFEAHARTPTTPAIAGRPPARIPSRSNPSPDTAQRA